MGHFGIALPFSLKVGWLGALGVCGLGTLVLLGLGCGGEPPSRRKSSARADATVHPEMWPSVESPIVVDERLEAALDELLGRMTVSEKVGQVIQAEIRHVNPEDVRRYRLGSILNGGGSHPGGKKSATAAHWLAMADAFYDASMDVSNGGQPIPIIWGVDAVHGHNNVVGATIFPHNIGLGATRNPELIRRIGQVTAVEMQVTGLDWNFGPTVAVVRDDRWGRTYEGFSEDPAVVSECAAAMVKGLQGAPATDDFLGSQRVIATAKHFLGDGGTQGGKDTGNTVCSEEDLRDIHGAGYVTTLEAGVQTVMASFSSWQGRKMHSSRELLTGVLKERMGFDGFVVGDWNAHGQLDGCSNADCPVALNAGVDMFMVPEDWRALHKNTVAQVESGEIPQARLDDAVRRILRVKTRAGMFQRGRPSSRPLAGKTELLGALEHRAVARQAVRESLVLLKNSGRLLPLRRDLTVLVAGEGANDIGKQCGGWTVSWQGTGNDNADFPGGTSIWDGIRQVVEGAGGTAILSEDGSFDVPPDVAIVVFGEEPYAETPGDRDTLEYRAMKPGDGDLLRSLEDAGIPVVSVLITGRPLWVNPELNASDAFVVAWLPGSEGIGVSDVLFRDADGSVPHEFVGKLAYSWPRDPLQTPLNAGDKDYEPLFPLGFGLRLEDGGELGELPEESGDPRAAAWRTVYFAGGPVTPWMLYTGDEVDPASPVTESSGASRGGHLEIRAVDRETQEDARAVRWLGTGLARLHLRGSIPVDLTRELGDGMALTFDVIVEEAPTGPVLLTMRCGDGCSGSVDLSRALADLPSGQWRAVRVPLRCFAEAGAEVASVSTPFEIVTAGRLALRFAAVRLEPPQDREMPCPGSSPWHSGLGQRSTGETARVR